VLDNIDDVTKETGTPADNQQKAHAKRLMKRIKSFKDALKDRYESWEKARNYADGDPENDGEAGLVRSNHIGSILETVQPAVYAKAPEIAVTLDDRIDTKQYPAYATFAETLQNALNTFLVKDAKLKTRGKSAVRSALTCTQGWVKVVYQISKEDDPLIRNRINDTQDNLDKIKRLIEETKEEGGECNEYEAKLFELEQQNNALEAQVEIVTAEGLVVDVIPPENLIILDASCRDIDEFMQATEIAHEIKMTVGAFKDQFKINPPSGAKKYAPGKDAESETESQGNKVDGDDYLIYVYEVWSLKDLTVYTICEGYDGYVRAPYQPESLGEQWYPFFGLQFRRVDGKKYPKSLVEQLIELQDEYNTRRTAAAEHRRKNSAVRILNKSSGVTDPEIDALNNRTIQTQFIGLTMEANQPITNQVGSLPEIPYNPAMYDTSDTLFDMEKVSNTQDAQSGAIRTAKTATEAEIQSVGAQGRSAEALDVLEDWLTEIAIYSAQLLLQQVPLPMIQKRFGDNAVWPELNKKDLFDMLHISIRSGSTSRPNKMRERDQWIQLLPEIQKTIEQIELAKQNGAEPMVKTLIKLLDETFKRFDERLDASELLGIDISEDGEQGEEGNVTEPQLPPEVMQQIEQGQQLIQDLQAEVQEKDQALKDKASDQQVQIKKAEIDAASSERVELIKTAGMITQAQLAPVSNDEQAQPQPDQVQAVLLQNVEALNNLVSTLAAPKRIVTDESGRPIGVETVTEAING
jgi:hypothetical protein